MNTKSPTINLIDFRLNPKLYHNPKQGFFQIESMKNTVKYPAGSWLKDEQVESLINLLWTVNIRKPKSGDYD